MRNQALGLPPTSSGRQEAQTSDQLRTDRTAPEYRDIVFDTIEDDLRLVTTPERSRSPGAGPDSSGDDDARGHRRRNRIVSQEKRELIRFKV